MSEDFSIQSHKGPYAVHFLAAPFENLHDIAGETSHFIVDAHVADIYKDQLAPVLEKSSHLLIEATEDNKNLNKFPAYVEHLVANGVRRDHQLVAIGGGIIQDITCFLSATLLRGVDWSFYPTTLLAQSDSCIGSKSSINSGSAKNILGTFTPPKNIYISAEVLSTLDPKDIRSGVGEMLKVHIIDGPSSFDQIAERYDALFKDPATMQRFTRRALEIKKTYIEKDEFDQGIRNIFNYGHSFGHAIEAATQFAIPHGIAVTIGMDMANEISAGLGVGNEAHMHRMRPCLRKNYAGFEDHPVPLGPFLSALSKDKKNVGSGSVTLILPDQEGRIFKDVYANDTRFQTLCQNFLNESRAA